MKKKYGLIGHPLGHSFSQKYFTDKFNSHNIDASYDLFPLESISELDELLKLHDGLCGFNVTIPYKQQIISKLDSLSESAASINAVNTVKVLITSDGGQHLKGFNTDAPAFEYELVNFVPDYINTALVLGTGGASAAVAFILAKLGWDFKFVSRNPAGNNCIHYSDIDKQLMSKISLIVNTTPLGMYPEIDNYPDIPYHLLTEKHFLFDLVYNPECTAFLQKGRSRGSQIKNGKGMLYKQADLAWDIWQSVND